nr:group II intron maturase-specific domain-containing protein [Clostridium carnis]
MRRLNQVLNGWSNYHNHVVSSKVFAIINNNVYLLLQRWQNTDILIKTNGGG